MPNYLRHYSGSMYFFTLITFERRKIFCQNDFLSAFRQAIDEVRIICPFTVIAWVQIPDHLHCIIEFEQMGVDIGKFWGAIKRKTTKLCPQYQKDMHELSLSKVLRNEKGIFHRRFYEHLIRDEKDLINHLNYIHYNPVKHGLVQNVKDWQYSTFHRYVKNGLYDENWGDNVDISNLNNLD